VDFDFPRFRFFRDWGRDGQKAIPDLRLHLVGRDLLWKAYRAEERAGLELGRVDFALLFFLLRFGFTLNEDLLWSDFNLQILWIYAGHGDLKLELIVFLLQFDSRLPHEFTFRSKPVVEIFAKLRSVAPKNIVGTTHNTVFHPLDLIPEGVLFLNCDFSHGNYLSIISGPVLALVRRPCVEVPALASPKYGSCWNKSEMKNPKWIYQQFVAFEEQAAAIYLQMASRFSPESPELSSFWLDMAMQEKQHAGLLQFCIAEELFAENLPTDTEIHDIGALLHQLLKRASEPDLSVADAFRVATQMEASEVNAIYDRLTTPVHNSMYLLRRKLATTLTDHVGSLFRLACKCDLPEETLKELERMASHHS